MDSREKFELFFGKSSDYYMNELDKNERGNKITFNLAAFLFGIFWCLYRKMHRQAIFLAGLFILITIIEELIIKNYFINSEYTKAIQLINSLLFGLLTGFTGNLIYINHAKKKIEQFSLKYSENENDLKLNLIKSGKTSIRNIIIAVIFYGALLILSDLLKK